MTTPMSFRALGVVLLEDGMDFNLVHEDTILPAAFTPSGKQYPENAASYSSAAYVNPYPEGYFG